MCSQIHVLNVPSSQWFSLPNCCCHVPQKDVTFPSLANPNLELTHQIMEIWGCHLTNMIDLYAEEHPARTTGRKSVLWHTFVSFRSSKDNSPSKHNLGENGLLYGPFSPGTEQNRLKFALFWIRLNLVAIIVLTLTLSFCWRILITSSSRGQIYHGYRKLQEQVVSDLRDIGQLSLGAANVKDIECCPPESENFVPCFNVSENLDLGLSKGEEVDCHCGPGSRQNCLVLPPANYKIPLRWPTSRDVIWHANVNITA